MSFLKKSLFLLSLALFSISVLAQSVEDAGAKYNEGNSYYKEKNFAEAITAYEAALEIAKDAGAAAVELKGSIEKQLMNANYANGKTLYKGGKFDAAIASFENTLKLSEELGDASKKKNSVSYIAKVRTSKGGSLLKKNKVDEAFAEYTMATEIYPEYYKAYYGLMLIYKSQNDMTNMMASADKVLELGADDAKAAKTIKKTKSTASKALVNTGAKEIQKGNGRNAIDNIENSFQYVPGNSNAYYYLALAYNMEKDWDAAITSSENALAVEPEKDKSDINFALGQAYEGKADAASACAAYKNVVSGPNVDAAKYQITQVLKCN
jgi:tetratricopeptide (TPR) repeat protein